MRKLLAADFSRLWKDKVFWLGMIFMFGLGIFAICGMYSDRIRYDAYRFLDDALFMYASVTGFLSAFFCSLFSGTEYSDGTIRNKIAVGHLRTSIYLSNWLTNLAAALLMAIVFLVSYCTLGAFLLNAPAAPPRQILLYVFISIFTVTAFVSIFNMLAMLITQKSTSAVLCMLVFLGIFIAAMTIQARLDIPEFHSGYGLVNGVVEQLPPEPNPKYLQPAARKVYQFFLDVLPTGQGIQLVQFRVVHPFLMMLSSALISAGTTVFGILKLKKKNIK